MYLGVDLHRKVLQVVSLDEARREVLSRRFEHSRDAFRRVTGELEPEPISVSFEATYGWGWFANLLADAGIESHMADPLATKAVGSGRVKNDAIDAATLAQLLRTNLLPRPGLRHRRCASFGGSSECALRSSESAPASSPRSTPCARTRGSLHVLDRGIGHVYIRPATPKPNGKEERSRRMDAEESHRLLDGVVIDDTGMFNERLREWKGSAPVTGRLAVSAVRPRLKLRQKPASPA